MKVGTSGNVTDAFIVALSPSRLVLVVDCTRLPVLEFTHHLSAAAVGHDDDDDDTLITIFPGNDLFSSSTIANLLSLSLVQSLSGEDLFCSSETAPTRVDRSWVAPTDPVSSGGS